MKNKVFFLGLFAVIFFSAFQLSAQTGVQGTVLDEYGQPLIGATVLDNAAQKGAVTDFNGHFFVETPAGNREIKISFIGYETKTLNVSVNQGQRMNAGIVTMKSNDIGLSSIEIVADKAKERQTPVAFTTLSKRNLEEQLGSRDIPLVMNLTPSVYATTNGGGSGDARINVRGFNQRNVAIMINGVPVNDMENGWVYWSNWDGIADATNSIQMQRGLSAVNLATPSIGGTMNIITSPAEHQAGGSAKLEYGSGNFLKTTISANTGLLNNKFALSASVVRKVGQGVVDATWTDAWAYYFGASFDLNEKNRFELFALGAPQKHGQNSYKQNVAAYSHDFAREIGADSATVRFAESKDGLLYNENWNYVSEDYTGKQYWSGKERDRYATNFINERENYYHKPLVNLNWYTKYTQNISQFTVVYYSGGTGGGSGTFGSMKWDYSGPSRIVNWDATIANNTLEANNGASKGILRNSVNEQWTVGALSRIKLLVGDNFKASVGVDWRKAKIDHYREVRDLLGGQFFVFNGNEFDGTSDYNKVLGDKIDYYNTNTVDWIGGFAQAEYSVEKFTAYGTFGYSSIRYSYVDHFKKAENSEDEFSLNSDGMPGFQIKGGISYRPMDGLSVYANFGYIAKSPIFDNVINDAAGSFADNPEQEKFTAFEGGFNYKTFDGRLNFNGNYYYTIWNDRAYSRSIQNADGTEGIVFIQGMNQLHQGFEFEGSYRFTDMFGIGAMASFANWEYTSDVSGSYKDYSDPAASEIEYNFYTKGLKVGDAPQTQFAAVAQFYPISGSKIQLDWRHYSNYYADWDPFSRTDEADRGQVWEVPSYMLFDLHVSTMVQINEKMNLELFGHVFNLLNTTYVSDAIDNSAYNGYYGYNDNLNHDANTAEIYVGLGRTFNAGLKLTF